MNLDFPHPQTELLKRRVRDAIISRAARIPGIVVALVADEISRDLRALGSDIDAALEYIEQLPEHARKAAAYEFFASFFSHYLPKKLIHRYVYGSGSPPSYILSEQEMVDCNPYINVMKCRQFVDIVTKIDGSKGPVTQNVNLACPAAALTNGTLGQFTVKMNGTLVARAPNDWKLSGTMTFYDVWDFDPKDFKTGGRSLQGELKTRFGNTFLPGKAFTVESVETGFAQNSTDATVVWKGGTPSGVPDRIADLDVEVNKRN